jgi:hypothetical protein
MRSPSFGALTVVCTLIALSLTAPPGRGGTLNGTTSPQSTGADDLDLVELSLGFNYIHLDHAGFENEGLAGFNFSGFVNLNSWLGIGGEFMADYGRNNIDVRFGPDVIVESERYVYVFGPRVTLWQNPRFRLFAEALAGGVHAEAKVKQGSFDRIASADSFAAAAGAGFDWHITRHFSWRIAQADYLPTELGDDWQNNFRVSTSVVYRFGHK